MIVAIIPAAGSGTRMKNNTNKVLLNIGGLPILERVLKELYLCGVRHFILPARTVDYFEIEKLIQSIALPISYQIVSGGKERQSSISNALKYLPVDAKWIVIHDGARPFFSKALFERVLTKAKETGASIPVVRLKDTVKQINKDQTILKTLERSSLVQVQTPQIFSREIIISAYKKAMLEGYNGTDDASLVEYFGRTVTTVEGDYKNIKITTPEDLVVGEAFLNKYTKPQIRIGKGFDVHRLVAERPCILGGIEVPSQLGLVGHSDADVIAHAVTDALLGALALGDIGTHFPDTDDRYKDANSMKLLEHVVHMVKGEGWELINLDITVMAEYPKIKPYASVITENLAATLQVDIGQVSLKATTMETLGFVGREEGIVAEAVVLIQRIY